MHSLLLTSILLVLAVALGLALFVTARPSARNLTSLANVAEGFWHGSKTYLATGAISTRYLLAKLGADAAHADIAAAADIPIGFFTDEATAAEDPVNVNLLGTTPTTQIGVASAAIALGAFIVPDAGGKIRTLPVTTGTYYIIGRALSVAAANNDPVVVDPCFPIQRVVP